MIRKLFLKRFRLYVVIMVLPMLLVILANAWFYMREERAKVGEMQQMTLKRMEDAISAELYAVIKRQDDLMSNPRYALSFRKMMNYSEMQLKDVFVVNVIKTMLSQNDKPFIHSVYLYLNGSKRVMATGNEQLLSVDQFYDRESLALFESMPETQTTQIWQRDLKRYSAEESKQVMTICYRLNYIDGAIILNIEREALLKSLQKIYSASDQRIALIADDGQALLVQDEDTADAAQRLIAHLNTQQGKTEDGRYIIDWQRSQHFPMWQVVFFPVSAMWLSLFQRIWGMLVLVVIIIVMTTVVAWISTRHSFRYIERCVNVFMMDERGDTLDIPPADENDEYSMILNNVIRMYLSNMQMRYEVAQKQSEKEKAERFALQMQINPHFISNTLQTIDMVVQRESGQANTSRVLLQKLNSIIRYIFRTPMQPVTVREELAYLRDYCEIQYVRFPNQCIVYYETDSEVEDLVIFRLMLQPLLENCFTHARKGPDDTIYVTISVEMQQDWVCFAVRDNGRGMTSQRLEEVQSQLTDTHFDGIGITNLNRRLILYYGEESGLHIQSVQSEGTSVSFRIARTMLLPDRKEGLNAQGNFVVDDTILEP